VIDGVKVVPLRQISDERGTVMHMLKRTDPHFLGFGEIYFTTVHPGVVKGWHKHQRMALNYACVHGGIKLVLYDDRENSGTQGEVMELELGPDDYQLVQIPTNVWNSFKGLGTETSIIANCATEPHTKEFTDAIDPQSASAIPYDWRQQDGE
jgi:dTDP-4-dehydrorhamnose 3,5-epimerase